MNTILVITLVLLALLAIVLFICWRYQRAKASHFQNLFNEARYQLGKVHDALADIPHDATTELGTVILRYKARYLKERNALWELQRMLNHSEPLPEDQSAPDKLARILANKYNAEHELTQIDYLLGGRPTLKGKKTRYDKIAFSIELNRKAAGGETISNRHEDYR